MTQPPWEDIVHDRARLSLESEFLMRPQIVDIHSLGAVAFSTAGQLGKSSKDILELQQILKVLFDAGNDSYALYAHNGVELQGVRDIQLMESACRLNTHGRRYLFGLSKYIEGSLFNKQEKDQLRLCKAIGEVLWNPQKGGSYSEFTA